MKVKGKYIYMIWCKECGYWPGTPFRTRKEAQDDADRFKKCNNRVIRVYIAPPKRGRK